jgi:hypothetical protein
MILLKSQQKKQRMKNRTHEFYRIHKSQLLKADFYSSLN